MPRDEARAPGKPPRSTGTVDAGLAMTCSEPTGEATVPAGMIVHVALDDRTRAHSHHEAALADL